MPRPAHAKKLLQIRVLPQCLETTARPKASVILMRCHPKAAQFSREVAKECSPRRKPWVECGRLASPEGAEDQFSRTLDSREVPTKGPIQLASTTAKACTTSPLLKPRPISANTSLRAIDFPSQLSLL